MTSPVERSAVGHCIRPCAVAAVPQIVCDEGHSHWRAAARLEPHVLWITGDGDKLGETMEKEDGSYSLSRRRLLQMIGSTAGAGAMYHAMSSLGLAAESPYQGPIDLQGAPHGASVLILGAGMAGMTAAYELRNAGYTVQVLEYNGRAGGRNWTIRGGDRYTELGGLTQQCEFDKDLYINPGPWRIPYHHLGMMHYAKVLGVPLEPFFQVNYNAYLHSTEAFGGKPQRYREVKADYQGHVAELLAKATRQNSLDGSVTQEDREKLLESLREWGALDKNYAYVSSDAASDRRGYEKKPGGVERYSQVWTVAGYSQRRYFRHADGPVSTGRRHGAHR